MIPNKKKTKKPNWNFRKKFDFNFIDNEKECLRAQERIVREEIDILVYC